MLHMMTADRICSSRVSGIGCISYVLNSVMFVILLLFYDCFMNYYYYYYYYYYYLSINYHLPKIKIQFSHIKIIFLYIIHIHTINK
jgi:hypothetical protein